MKSWKLWLAIGLLALFLWVGDGDPLDGAITFINEITRGKRLTHAPPGADGVVPDDPQALADQAGVDLELYCLARSASSEEGSSDNATKAAVMWCTWNYANKHGNGSIADLVLHARDPNHSGHFGTERNIDVASPYYTTDSTGKPNANDRYCTTAADPYQGDIDLAAAVLSGAYPDPTGGADQFDRPAGEKHPEAVAAKRLGAGAQPVAVAGVNPGIRWWRTG